MEEEDSLTQPQAEAAQAGEKAGRMASSYATFERGRTSGSDRRPSCLSMRPSPFILGRKNHQKKQQSGKEAIVIIFRRFKGKKQ